MSMPKSGSSIDLKTRRTSSFDPERDVSVASVTVMDGRRLLLAISTPQTSADIPK